MWKYNSYVFAFEKAMAEENDIETIKILNQMFDAMLTPWDISNYPIYKHIGNDKHEMNLGKKMLSSILDEMEKSEKYDFLRNEEEFHNLINKYRAIVPQ